MNKDFLYEAADLAMQTDPHCVAPNPRVACLVVKDNKIIGQGIYEKFGQNHAEIKALENLREDLTNAKIFITLEPCDHFVGKKTKSCTDFLIEKLRNVAGVEVCIGALDPKFNGKNIEKIKAAGIDCQYARNEKCEKLNPFLKNWVEKKTPFLRLKIAMSLDGKITSQKKGWISNEFSRQNVHQSRANFSAILTTTETILQDDPRLDARIKGFARAFSNPPLLIFGKQEIPKTAQIFQIKNREIHFLAGDDLAKDFAEIKKLNIDSILTECGSRMATALLQANLVNEIELFIAPQIFGKGINVFENEFDIAKKFSLESWESLADDLRLKFVKK